MQIEFVILTVQISEQINRESYQTVIEAALRDPFTKKILGNLLIDSQIYVGMVCTGVMMTMSC